MVQCEWFVMCDQEAAGAVRHPVLGAVPTCQWCADKLGLTLEPMEVAS